MNEPAAPSSPPPPPPGGGAAAPSGNRGLMIVLSYLWLLALIPLLVEKDDAEVQWHAKHGIVLLVAEFILWIVLTIISIALTPLGVGCFFALLPPLISLVVIVVHIVCIVKGVGGQRFLIPGISQYADRF